MSVNYLKESTEHYDALVVGSGVSGGWAAKELTERGLKTLMLERGGVVEHRKDYPGESQPPWKLEHRGRVPLALAESEQPVQSRCYAYNAQNRQFFGNDKDLPYSVLRKVMATCTEADYGRVSLAVMQKVPAGGRAES